MKLRPLCAAINGASTAGLPLFDWASAGAYSARVRINWTLPGRVLERRYGLSPSRAELIAGLAGFGGGHAE